MSGSGPARTQSYRAASATGTPYAAGIVNGPAPAWSMVAGDYDGVHLTFAGLLTGLYVPRTTEEVSTTRP